MLVIKGLNLDMKVKWTEIKPKKFYSVLFRLPFENNKQLLISVLFFVIIISYEILGLNCI